MNKEYNNNFLSYTGKIDRKNYAINMSILIVLACLLFYTDFSIIFKYSQISMLYEIFTFILGFAYVIIFGCVLSVVYRRVVDISENRSKKFKDIMTTLYAIFLCIPFAYYFLEGILNIPLLSMIIYFGLYPLSLIFCIIIGFVKHKERV